MRKTWSLLLLLTVLSSIVIVFRTGYLGLLWITNLASAALALSTLSPISISKRATYLTATMPHISLFSASIAAILSLYTRIDIYILATITNLSIVLMYQYLVDKGIDQEIVTSIILSLTTSMSVLSLYFLYRNVGYTGEISALFLGEPLLISRNKALLSLMIAILTFFSIFTTWKEQVTLGVDKEYAYTAGLRSRVYEYVFYVLLAISGIIYLRTVGYILLHVLLLMPGSIAILGVSNLRHLLIASISFTLFATSLSLLTSLYLNLSPVGLIGLFMLTLYIALKIVKLRGK